MPSPQYAAAPPVDWQLLEQTVQLVCPYPQLSVTALPSSHASPDCTKPSPQRAD
jgi:hypothetical protein